MVFKFKNKIKYSFIIPVHNNSQSLEICLNSIKKQINYQSEIIIIDDCSTQPKIKDIANKYAAKFLRLTKNCGAGRARNYGVKIARGKYLIFIDSDVIVPTGFFKKLLKRIKTLPVNTCLQGVYGLTTPIKNIFSQYKNLYYYHNFFHRIKGNNFYYLSSHCFIIPKRIFNKLKGFNSKIKTVIEDADLSYRLLKNNYKVILDRTLIVSHYKDFSLTSLLINDAKLSFAKIKHLLRNLVKDDKDKLIVVSGGRIKEIYPLILNTLITPLLLIFFLLSLFFHKTILFFIILLTVFLCLNADFFQFISKIKKNWIIVLKIIFIFYLDMLFAFLGVILGAVDYYFLGKKY